MNISYVSNQPHVETQVPEASPTQVNLQNRSTDSDAESMLKQPRGRL